MSQVQKSELHMTIACSCWTTSSKVPAFSEQHTEDCDKTRTNKQLLSNHNILSSGVKPNISDTDVSMGTSKVQKEENTAMQTAASLGAKQITERSEEKAVTTPKKVRKPKATPAGRRAVVRILGESLDAFSKDFSSFMKDDEATAGRLEKQVSQISAELNSVKSRFSKESAALRGNRKPTFQRCSVNWKRNPRRKQEPRSKVPRSIFLYPTKLRKSFDISERQACQSHPRLRSKLMNNPFFSLYPPSTN